MGLATSTSSLVQTPLLGRLVDAIREDQRLVVIDLGVLSSSLVSVLQPFRARLDALAIGEQLDAWFATETQEECSALIAQHLMKYQLEPADWLLCWGFLNYFDPPSLTSLVGHLKPHLKPSARVHALIEYSSPTMPATPPICELSFNEGKTYLDLARSRDTIPSPRYTPKRLEGMLRGYQTENAILLSNGMQEYVFSPLSG